VSSFDPKIVPLPRRAVDRSADPTTVDEALGLHLDTLYRTARALTGAELDAIARTVRPADKKRLLRGEATAFVCERGSCQMPTGDPAILAGQLARARPLLADRSPPALSVP